MAFLAYAIQYVDHKVGRVVID